MSCQPHFNAVVFTYKISNIEFHQMLNFTI